MRRARRPHLIEKAADGSDHLEVGALAEAADVVALANLAAHEHEAERARMILHVEPVPHIAAGAVDGHGLTREPLQDHERDQLLGELKRPIVVRAVRDQRGQPIGLVPRTDQMV